METTEGTSELVQLVETSGLEVTKQNQIAETLGVFFNKAAEWDATIKSIVITSPEETGKMKMAKEGRLTLKNMRLDAEKIVKAKRDEVKYAMVNFVLEDKLWLKAGQMMEATFKNLETKLEEKEKFAERWEAEQKEKLKAQRLEQLLPLGFQFENGFDLGNMDEQMFQSLKLGLETAKKEKEEAERKAIEKEKAETEERERIRIENEKLKSKALAKEKQLIAERAKAKAERKEIEARAAKAKADADAKLKAEKQAKEKLQAEIRAKAEAEAKAKREAEAVTAAELKAKQLAEKKAKAAPDKIKLNDFAKMLDELVLPELKSKEAENIADQAKHLLSNISAFIRKETSLI